MNDTDNNNNLFYGIQPTLSSQSNEEQNRDDRKVFEMIIHLLFIEYLCAYYMDNNLFLLILRVLQVFCICRVRFGVTTVNTWTMFIIILFSNAPSFLSHLFMASNESLDDETQQIPKDHFLLLFFNGRLQSEII